MKYFKLNLPANIDSLKEINLAVESFARNNNLDSKVLFNLQLIIEEIVTNICYYAFEGEKGEFSIEVSLSNNNIILVFTDNGIEFDPIQKDIIEKKKLKDSVPGGLGIYIVKKLAHEMSYNRINNKNILKIVM